ncbi:MAG: hypothetical protein J7639_02985 [Paenibacillaceae bacterium]|nr:hypothetical protein [Paenibacillaceae bacterium]
MEPKKWIAGAALTVVVAAVVAAAFVKEVSPGYTGVLYDRVNGKTAEGAIEPGWHWIAPWRKAIVYPSAPRTVELPGPASKRVYKLPTSDGAELEADVSYSYHVDAGNMDQLIAAYQGQSTRKLEAGPLRSRLLEAMRGGAAAFTLAELYGEKREEAEGAILSRFASALEPSGIVIDSFAFVDLRPNESYLSAAQEKINAQLALDKANLELEQKNAEAEQRRVEAESLAEKTRIETAAAADKLRDEAQAAADKLRIDAEGLAEKQRIEAEAAAEVQRIANEAKADTP